MKRVVLCCLTLVVGHVTNAVHACMVCLPMPQVTAADRLIDATVVAFARENSDRPFSYRAVEVLKGNLESDEIDLFVNSSVRRRMKTDGDLVAVVVRDKNRQWRTLALAGPRFQLVVRRVLSMAPQWSGTQGKEKRCEFFLTLFGHDDPALFELAYLELGRAPYSTIKRVAKLVPKERLQPILDRTTYIEWRSLAILMLTQNADEQDRDQIRMQFDDASRFALTTNLGAWATAYIELDREVAIEAIDRQYLSNRSRSTEEIRAVISALSVHGRNGHTHLRDQIVRSYAVAIKNHPDASGMIARDLATWKRLEHQAQLRNALERPNVGFEGADRQAILNYLSLRPSGP